MNPSLTAESLIYTERTDDDDSFEPTQEDIEEFAKRIGLDISLEPELIYLAREGLRAPLPSGWKPCRQKTKDRDVWFYYNSKTDMSQWEHPMDPVYREKVIHARSELALNKIQSFDPITMRPPKSLPPLKRAGSSLAPINPAASSLGKLGGFRPAAGDLRQTVPSPLSNNSYDPMSNNNNQMGRLQNNSNTNNIISSSSLNPFKDDMDDEDDSVRFMKPQPPRKLGLTLTGGGSNFLKGSEGFSRNRRGSIPSNNSLESVDGTVELDGGGAGDMDKKPIKSILVNHIPRSRPTNPSDNVYELDGFSMNLDEMTDEEKMVVSQLESITTSRSKGNVKFNLDENTELKFEMSGDDNEDYDSNENQPQNDIDTEEDSDENYRSTPDQFKRPSPGVNPSISHFAGRDNSLSNNIQQVNKVPNTGSRNKHEIPFTPEYSEEDIAAMKKAMREEMEAELNKFKEQLEKERKTRQEQIQKHLEETVAQFKMEKDDTIKRLRKDLDNEKTFEVDKARREIDTLLQKELEQMKLKFDNSLQARQKELEEEHQKKIDVLTSEFRKNEEERITVALRHQVSEDVVKATESELKKQKETAREEHKRHMNQLKDYHKTVLAKLQAELLAEEEKLRQDHILRQAEIVSKFEKDTEVLKRELIRAQKEALEKVQEEFELKRAALEETLKASLQDVRNQLYQNKRSSSENNIPDKAAEDELRSMKAKYQQLENKYKTMKKELQQLTQEMSARRRSSLGNSVAEQKPSNRSSRSLPKGNSKAVQLNDSLDVSDTNQDSAHGSESNTETNNSSVYPSSEGIAQQVRTKVDSVEPSTEQRDGSSQSNRINAALQALEVLKQEILDLKDANSKKKQQHESPPIIDNTKKIPSKPSVISSSKTSSARMPSKYDISSPQDVKSARKKSTSTTSSKSARVKVSSPSPPTHDTSIDVPPPKYVSRSVSVIPQDFSDPISEDTHQRIVEDAKAFIRMQKNRLKDPSPIPNSSHLILPTTKNNLLLFDEKMLKSVSPRRPASIHLDLVSETESSGVSSLKDHRSNESKKLSKDIDEICNSLISLDQQMKLIWSVVKDKQQQSYYHDQDESPFLNTSSDFTAMLPNTIPIILGKSARVCASLPSSARKPLVPPTTPVANQTTPFAGGGGLPMRNFSSLLSSNQNSSSQTVLDALRMSGLSTTRLDCTDLLKSLEEELKEFRSTKQRLLDIQESLTNDDKKSSSPRHKNNSNSNILAKTKDLQEWIKKY